MATFTALGLQQELIAEIATILDGIELKDTNGNPVKIRGFEQELPKLTEDEEEASQFFPYYIVQLHTGSTIGDTEDDEYDCWHVPVVVQFGIFDDDKEGHAHRAILTMIQKISDRFNSRPLLGHAYRAERKMDWEILDEDTYPFLFGALEMNFMVPKMERSDDYE